MAQYLNRKNALRKLSAYTKGATEKHSLDLLVGALCRIILEIRRAENNLESLRLKPKLAYEWDKEFNKLKYIARSLGLYPISEEVLKAYEIRNKISGGIGLLSQYKRFTTSRPRWGILTGPVPSRNPNEYFQYTVKFKGSEYKET